MPFARTTRQCEPIITYWEHPSTFLVATLAKDPLSSSELSGATHVLPRHCWQSPGTQSPFSAGLLVEKPLWSRTLFILVKLPSHLSSRPAAPQRPLPTTKRKMTTFCHRRHHTHTPPSLSPRNGPPHWRLASTSWGDSLQTKTTTAETTLLLLILISFPTQYDRDPQNAARGVPPATTNQRIDRPSVASEVRMDGQEPGKHPTWIKADWPISAPIGTAGGALSVSVSQRSFANEGMPVTFT